MDYFSTRNDRVTASASMAILNGIAPDGGLYTLSDYSDLLPVALDEIKQLSARQLSGRILSALLPDFEPERISAIVDDAYIGRFETDDITPLVPVGDDYVLELFRGPTSAFKDVALCVLPRLMAEAKRINGVTDEIVVLTATSGDTGKAALSGFRDVPGARIIVFYPENGVSLIQQAQMVTQEGKNVSVCAIRGNFDDAQTAVKKAFAAAKTPGVLPDGIRLSSANSINIGRLAPQVMYYYKAYGDLRRARRIRTGERVNFIVPTGNFGDILAGYIAKRMGLPIAKLVCASNENDVLYDFIRTGTYDRRRTFHRTASPSMDILISSNLERLLYLLCHDPSYVAHLMDKLTQDGHYTISGDMRILLGADFSAFRCNDQSAFSAIRYVYDEYGYLMDTHTAVAYDALRQFKQSGENNCPNVVLSTASPYKFCTAVLKSLGGSADGDEFAVMRTLNEMTGVPIPAGLASLREKAVLHTDVIDTSDVLQYVIKNTR